MPKSKKEITKNDRKILDELEKNARQSLIEISDNTGLSRQTVQKTLLKLEKNHVIWGYKIIVDEQKKGLTEYILLVKRTTKPIDKKYTEVIISKELAKLASEVGIEILNAYYCNGSYDWIICFLASDIKKVTKFIERVKTVYGNLISDIQVLETIFIAKKEGFFNPDYINIKKYL